MRFSKMIQVVNLHTGGCYGDVIIGGVLDVPGDTVFDKMRYLETQNDELRQFLINEPRGHKLRPFNLIVPSNNPEADVGFIIMLPNSYVAMSGSNTICTATTLLETGMIKMVEPITEFTMEAPGGLVRITAECRDGRCESVKFMNVPSIVLALDRMVEVEGIGSIKVDVAFGGMIYGMVDAKALGFEIVPSEAKELVAVGERIKAAVAEQVPVSHPENPLVHTVNQTLWAGPVFDAPEGKRSRNAVIVSPGGIDRSACGSGTCARMAIMQARGEMKVGEKLIHESILDTIYIGEVHEAMEIEGHSSIRGSITGTAHIIGFQQFVLDPKDPFPTGYRLGDMW